MHDLTRLPRDFERTAARRTAWPPRRVHGGDSADMQDGEQTPRRAATQSAVEAPRLPAFSDISIRAPDQGGRRGQTSTARHTLRATIRRGATAQPGRGSPVPSTRADAEPGQQQGGEAFSALFEQLGATLQAPGGQAAALAPATETTTMANAGSASPAHVALGVPIRVPDIEVPALAEIGKSDTVAGAFTYSGSIANSGAAPDGFGVTRSFGSKLTGVTITPGAGSFAVAATFEHPITYQVRAVTGPSGQLDIASATDADITKANYATVVADLTPDMSDLDGRPPRTQFWAKDLTLKHERVHADDDKANGPGAMATVTTWLNGKTAADVAQVNALLGALPGRFATALLAALSTEAGEKHAYSDGAALYTARADAIKAKGVKGDYA